MSTKKTKTAEAQAEGTVTETTPTPEVVETPVTETTAEIETAPEAVVAEEVVVEAAPEVVVEEVFTLEPGVTTEAVTEAGEELTITVLEASTVAKLKTLESQIVLQDGGHQRLTGGVQRHTINTDATGARALTELLALVKTL